MFCRSVTACTRKACTLLFTALFLPLLHAQPLAGTAWFGVPLPPAFTSDGAPAIVGERGPVPARVPEGEEAWTEFAGTRLWQDLERIVAFSHASREQREIGSGQLWGRIAGFESARATVEWMLEQYRAAGITATELQEFQMDEGDTFWLPLAWELRLKTDPAFGTGSEDIVLHTAMPLAPTALETGELQGALVYVGTASPAELAHIDVRGRIAVQQVTPQAHMVFEREPTVPRARNLFERGAIAVINIVEQPGNERAMDLGNCGGPCFNVGGRDGLFLESVLSKAAEAGLTEAVRAEVLLEAGIYSNLIAENGVAVLPGRDSDEIIVLNAHVDAWFDGAGDNGDGMAVQLALARHFARPQNRPSRTLVFVASAGHHTSGLSGPANFVRMNPGLAANTVLTVNIEHVAQRNFAPARSQFEDGYREFSADSGEAPIVAGITNSAPFLQDLVSEGVTRYGVNFMSGNSTMASGEGGGYRDIDAPIVTFMQAPPLYHTSGEDIDAISEPGLERMARFLAFFVKAVDQAPRAQIDPR